jgi:excinuclease ABC subunit C
MFVRGGRSLGSRTFFPRQADDADDAEVLRAFLLQYYAERDAPAEIITSLEVPDRDLLADMLSERAERRVPIRWRVRGDREKLLRLAVANAEHAAEHQSRSRATLNEQFEALEALLELADRPERIECFDISHTGGSETVGSCVAFDRNGPLKSAYRRYNVRDVQPGDDYGALRQVLMRRFSRAVAGESALPDVALIDGGRGQLRQAMEVLAELGLNGVELIGVAKGTGRKAGRESLYRPDGTAPLRLPSSSPALTLIQQLRDESHRFALTGHRDRRQKSARRSALDDISGLGPKRRQALMRQFGGLQGIASAGTDDLARVSGISQALAQRIYDRFHAS